MTSNSAVPVIPECKGNYGSAQCYYYLILVTGWGWDLVSPSPVWPREEWGLPPSPHPVTAREEGRKGGRAVRAGLGQDSAPSPTCGTLARSLPPWCQDLAPLHSRSFGGGAANWRKGTTLPASILAAEQENMPSLSVPCWFCWFLPPFALSLLWPSGTTQRCWIFPSCAHLDHQHKHSLACTGFPFLLRWRFRLWGWGGAFKPGFLGVSSQVTSWGPFQPQWLCVSVPNLFSCIVGEIISNVVSMFAKKLMALKHIWFDVRSTLCVRK